MITISKSVGIGGQAPWMRKDPDTLKVQQLLNQAGTTPRLKEDGILGNNTVNAIRKFQSRFLRNPDALVEPGKTTIGRLNEAAGVKGPPSPKAPVVPSEHGPEWMPPRPLFPPLNYQGRIRTFGEFTWTHPVPGSPDPDHIQIDPKWVKANITTVKIPQLGGIRKRTSVSWHRKGVEQLRGLWAAWEKAGLLPLVLTYHGSFVPRFMRRTSRQRASQLSNHSWGTAFDINYKWNKLGHTPAKVGSEGSVRELVPLANAYGFYWGGHFGSRPDGMHFELARVGMKPEGPQGN